MRSDVAGGTALIIGAILGLVTMGLHPTGHEVAHGQAALSRFVHSLALLAVPLVGYGGFVLTRRLTDGRGGDGRGPAVAEIAFAFHLTAAVATLLAAVASGFVATDLLASARELAAEDRARAGELIAYTAHVNQAFARLLVAASSMAIGLWSIALRRVPAFPGGVAIYGIAIALLALLALFTGHLRLDIHGFGAVVLAQAVWLILVGLWLRRSVAGPAVAGPL